MVSSIKGSTCRDFAASRTTPSMARHELETLRAAVNYFHKEYGLDPVPAFTLPQKHRARERWLTRDEAAALLWQARRTPHVARFILIGLYTGTRSGAILGLSWLPSIKTGWIDLEQGIMHRSGSGQRETNKRQPPVAIARQAHGPYAAVEAAGQEHSPRHQLERIFGAFGEERLSVCADKC
jgi:integrase